MTIFSKNFGGAWPLGPPWLRVCSAFINAAITQKLEEREAVSYECLPKIISENKLE